MELLMRKSWENPWTSWENMELYGTFNGKITILNWSICASTCGKVPVDSKNAPKVDKICF